MFKKALLLLALLLAAVAAKLAFPELAESIGGGEALERAVTVLGRSLLA